MSVINQMLKDLGERHSRSELRLTDMLDRQPGVMTLSRKYRVTAGPVLVMLAGVLVLGFLLWQQSQRGGTDAPAVAAVVPAEQTHLKRVEHPDIEAAVIGSIGIETDGSSLKLIFESDKAPAQAVTQTFNEDGSIDYVFAQARLQTALPVLQENPFIKSYTVTQRKQDVVVRLVPAAGAEAFFESAVKPDAAGHRTVIGARVEPMAPAVAARAEPPAPVAVAPKKKPAVAKRAPAASDPAGASDSEKIEITRRVSLADQAETWYRQGLEKLQADRVEGAVHDLRKAVSLQPDMHVARELLAALLLRSGQSAEAHAELQRGMRLKPEHTAYARLYAQSLIEAGDPAGALRVLATSEPYAAQQPDYRAFMAAVTQRLAQHEESVRHYMAALELKPARSAWWVGMAISLEALGRAQEAAQAYRTALAGNELNADLMNYARSRVTLLGETRGGG